jgi:hypothetical protein
LTTIAQQFFYQKCGIDVYWSTLMIETHEFEQVTQIKMSRELDGKSLYWVAAYLVDGLLIDTGCSYTSGELVSWLRDKKISKSVLFEKSGQVHPSGSVSQLNKPDIHLRQKGYIRDKQ